MSKRLVAGQADRARLPANVRKERGACLRRIVLTISAEVASGPKMKETRTLAIDAYDKISVTVPDGTDLEVELQPGGTGSIRLLIVKSNVYGAGLKYTVNADTTDTSSTSRTS